MKHPVLKPILIASLLFASTIAYAAETVSGTIDFVNLKSKELVVNDTEYRLAPNYTVKDSKGKPISAFNLKKGRLVKFQHEGNRLVQELTIQR